MSTPAIPGLSVTISEPIAAIATGVSNVVIGILAYTKTVRETASPAAKDEMDHISAQAYWDYRNALKFLGIVGEPIPWPPKVSG